MFVKKRRSETVRILDLQFSKADFGGDAITALNGAVSNVRKFVYMTRQLEYRVQCFKR